MNTERSSSSNRILLYACVGGHLDQLCGIAEKLQDYNLTFVVNDNYAVRKVMENRTLRISFAERDIRQFINIFQALQILWKVRPSIIISTGSSPAVWFFYFGKFLFGAKLIFVESIARVDSFSLTGRLVLPIADYFFVQWEGFARKTDTLYYGVIGGGK